MADFGLGDNSLIASGELVQQAFEQYWGPLAIIFSTGSRLAIDSGAFMGDYYGAGG